MQHELITNPTTLSLIATYKCTAACNDCCFSCSPKREESLTFLQMKNYIDKVVNTYPDIVVVVITGGECFLLKKDLIKTVEYAANKSLHVRVVTNGYWARGYKQAINRLTPLVSAGLKEINFSTGDDHQKYVPIQNVINAAIASMDLGLTTLINVESNFERSFKSKTLFENEKLKKYLHPKDKTIQPLRIVNGLWMPFTKETQEKTDNVNKKTNICYDNKKRCTNLFNTITITPTHRMVACCGLVCNYTKYLDLGNAEKESIKLLYDNQFNDFLKIWLSVEGPYSILKFISNYIDIDFSLIEKNRHVCQLCGIIFNNESYIDIIKNNSSKIYSNIMFKYVLNKKMYFK